MILFLTLIHILVALLLVLFVLIQDAKGDGVFGMGGGGSNQVLSSTGAASFLVKTTRILAIIFAATSITLTYLTSKHGGSVTDTYVPPPASAPLAPAAAKPGDAKPGSAPAAGAAAPAEASKPGQKPAESPESDK